MIGLEIKSKYVDRLELKDFSEMNDIGKCLIYKSNPKWFIEFDSGKKAIEIYDKTLQSHNTNRYDTITSWIEFAKTFLGFSYGDGINLIEKDFDCYSKNHPMNHSEEHDVYKEWVKSRIKKAYFTTKENTVNQAYNSFLAFSKAVYSIGNIVPVGYSPKPIRRNDRWDCKIQWIHDMYFTKSDDDTNIRRSEEWKKFLGEITWEKYIEKYFLQDFVGEKYEVIKPASFPIQLSDWIVFFDKTSSRVKKRENRIISISNCLQNSEDK